MTSCFPGPVNDSENYLKTRCLWGNTEDKYPFNFQNWMEGVVSNVILRMSLQWIFKGSDCKHLENDQPDILHVSARTRFSMSQVSLTTSFPFLTRVTRLKNHGIVAGIVTLCSTKTKVFIDILTVKITTLGECEKSPINLCTIQRVVRVDLCQVEKRCLVSYQTAHTLFPI